MNYFGYFNFWMNLLIEIYSYVGIVPTGMVVLYSPPKVCISKGIKFKSTINNRKNFEITNY